MLFIFLLVLLLLIALGMPIAFALGTTLLVLLVTMTDMPLVLLPQQMISGADNYALIAIPFFMLAAEIMSAGGITKRLIAFFMMLIGWIRGGLALVNVGASIAMASFSGSAVADASMIGSVMIPAMKEKGYKPEFAASVTATASVLGVIMPPSIPMIVLGFITGTSVLKMFMGGLIPGLLVGVVLLITVYLLARRLNLPTEAPRERTAQSRRESLSTIWALVLPVIVIGGIRFGVFTITESSVFAVVYALLVAFFIYKELTWASFYRACVNASITSATVMLIVAAATGSAWLLSSEEVPQAIAAAMATTTDSPIIFLLIVVVFLLLVGTVIDLTPALLILGPILLPVAVEFGIDPIHFSIIMVTTLAFGLVTPPVGTCLFLCSGIAKVSVTKVIVQTLPLLAAMLAVLMLMVFFPSLVTWLPSYTS